MPLYKTNKKHLDFDMSSKMKCEQNIEIIIKTILIIKTSENCLFSGSTLLGSQKLQE